MRSTPLAEWMLALVTNQDRAATIVGDLLEEAGTRGVCWFWSSVVRTAASLLWRDVADHAARMTRLAFGGLALQMGLTVLALVLAAVAGSAVGLLGAGSGSPAVEWRLVLKLVVEVPLWVTPFVIGRVLARWAPGGELAACLAYLILGSIVTLVIMIVFPGRDGVSSWGLLWGMLGDAAQQAPLLVAGAVWGRRLGRLAA